MSELLELKKFTKTLADKSSEVIKKYFRSEIQILAKADESPVTIADKQAEEIMREIIMKEFPSHGIVGEEKSQNNIRMESIQVIPFVPKKLLILIMFLIIMKFKHRIETV